MRAQERSCWSTRLPGALLACALAMLPLAAGCTDDEKPPVQALTGSKPGVERYVVYLEGEPPDLTEYETALADSPGDVLKIVEGLRQAAAEKHEGFARAIRAYDGKVVDHWYLTNAVTIEIPAGNAASLSELGGVVRVMPDEALKP